MNDADYKAEADANLSIALAGGYQHLATADLISIAQVNATLHLAEQQRVANLLAYQALHPNSHTTLDNSVADQIWEAMSA